MCKHPSNRNSRSKGGFIASTSNQLLQHILQQQRTKNSKAIEVLKKYKMSFCWKIKKNCLCWKAVSSESETSGPVVRTRKDRTLPLSHARWCVTDVQRKNIHTLDNPNEIIAAVYRENLNFNMKISAKDTSEMFVYEPRNHQPVNFFELLRLAKNAFGDDAEVFKEEFIFNQVGTSQLKIWWLSAPLRIAHINRL